MQQQAQAVDAMLASGAAPVEAQPPLLAAQAAFALESNNFAAAESSLTRLLTIEPNNVQRITQLAQVKMRLGKRADALALYQRAMQLSAASGQPAPEDLLRQMLALAYEGRMAAPALEYSRALITAYPNAENWRSVLGVHRDLSAGGGPATVDIDLSRLMRAAHALSSEADYADYADTANRAGLPGEAKAVIEEGLAHNAFPAHVEYARGRLAVYNARVSENRAGMAAQRIQALGRGSGEDARIAGDTYFGYGEYPQAAELYRAALTKGQDPNLINIRLGAALAMAGQRAEAEAAFHAVTGPRAQLAGFWLLWLASPH
jgi:tetratricopeptide (TPR) repeat protein